MKEKNKIEESNKLSILFSKILFAIPGLFISILCIIYLVYVVKNGRILGEIFIDHYILD